ncbi:hypothetical protein N7478_011053 [Penicillium angulare]|uniref:uncharacterized protein n=1 Tax=Penicillium angulare TaxID=116970 RepID=UPI002541A68C|nr:uncharacterized protein N7478_011053 [Penicillium angulare]KAJ5263448.1 hypothetical protein N7478_011053 [Penicillium angulare]
MTQTISFAEDIGSWNPAFRPEHITPQIPATMAEDGPSDTLVNESAPEASKPDVKSPLSDDDFSAWDMPEDKLNPELQPTSLNSVMAGVAQENSPNGDNVQDEIATDLRSADSTTTTPSHGLPLDAAPTNPESVVTVEPQHTNSSEPAAIFTSTDDSVDFSELLAKGTDAEQPANQLSEPVEEETVFDTIPDAPAQEASQVQPQPAETAQAESSSIDAVFASSEETDDFSALLSANTEPASVPQAAEPVEYRVPSDEEQTQSNEDLSTTPQSQLPVDEAPVPQVSQINTENGFANEPTGEESLKSIDQRQQNSEAPLSSTTANNASEWMNQGDGEMDSDGDDFFNQLKTQTKPIFAPPEAESRFEEGVPLLEEDGPESPDRAMFDDDASNNPFGNDHGDDPEGFFSSSKRPDATDQPTMHITRKSTSQVMESVGFDIASPASDISAAAQFDDVIKAATSDPQEDQAQSSAPVPAAAPAEDDLAARWEAELSDAEEEDLAARWEAALDLDDIDDDEDAAQATQYVPQSPLHAGPAALNSPFETPQQQQQTPPRPIPGVYVPHQPSTADLVGGVGFPGAPPQNSSVPPYYAQQPPNPVNSRGESFAERSKEGYKSPYDLPDDLSRPRRPILTHKPTPKVDNSMPPPPPPGSGPGHYIGSAAAPPFTATAPSAPAPTAAPVAPLPTPKNFFEELPMPAPRSRPASSGRYTPNPTVTATGPSVGPPPQNPYATIPAPTLASQPPVGPPAAPPTAHFPAHSSLEPPERLDPYGSTGLLASSAPSGPIATSRYSPKPPGLQPSGKPASSPRYSPAPPPVPAGGRGRYASQPLSVPGQGSNMPFQPRTSSPLAYHEKVSYQPNEAQQMPPPSLQPSVDLSPPRQRPSVDQGSPYAPQTSNGSLYAPGVPQIPQQTPPKLPYAPQEYLDEFTKRMTPNNNYAPAPAPPMVPDIQPSQPLDSGVVSPRRSQTQSPGQQQLTSPRAFVPSIETMPRPASVHGSSSPTKTVNPYAPQQAANRARAASKASQQLEFIVPTDGQEQDPLGRWKGAPIFKFGFGGSVISCFPKHIPRYSAGIPSPMIKPTLGDPRYSQLDSWLPSGDTIVPHPGPLKAKSKKKDVLAWLSSKIAAFENEETPSFNNSQPDARARHEEKILLWKMTKILVENDGTLEGSPEIQKSLRQVIFPSLQESQPDGSYGNSFAAPGAAQPFGLPSQADSADAQWSQELRTNLLLGEREKAVWGAVDRRLWGHAMIIASTMEKSIWKQVVQEYVRREVRSPSGGTESLAALYEIFAGNVEESIDELVPPSARAGHHLISKADGQGTSKNALAGLESWRDTLGLVLSNRSSDDHQALLALGHLLASYGRIEAAHICFIFSRSVVFGGADDPQANIVLLGADHQRLPCTLLDEDAILLTEIYEFATSVLANSPTANLSHLLAFKLLHAKYLADRGRKTEAQNYCDSLATSLKSTTRPSPYHHQYLFAEIDELSARLRQTASDGNSSWISKPSMERVSGSMWARFNSFVAGDESDAASNVSGKAPDAPEFGPFANVAGTPTVSRSPSMSDMYGSYPGAGAQPIPAGGSSKYLPSSQYAPTASPDQQFRGRSSMDSQRSASGGLAFGQRRLSQEPETPVDSMFSNALMYGSPGSVGYQPTPPQSSYVPLAPVREDATQSPADASQPAVNGLFYQPPGSNDGSVNQSPFYQGPPGMPQAENSGYMPPAVANSYAPPSYAPDVNISLEHSESQDEEELNHKKKAFMDDDDDEDLAARASALKISQKQENDRKADEAFRKAAEEDEKRGAAQQGQKKGWFGGWFGGAPKKEPDNVGGGPIKAKLGEENSFYYDNDLKKWVNKKDPGSGTAARATPPPPRGSAPPSRASSGSMPPPPAPMSAASGSRPPSSSSDAAPLSSSPAFAGLSVPPPMPRSVSSNAALSSSLPGSSSGLAPPRPASSLSHAQSIDDLLGAPTARKGGAVRGKKKGRYVDVMAK